MPKRIELEPATGIASSYKKKWKNEYFDISCFNNVGQRGNFITPDFFHALKQLDEMVTLTRGKLHIIDLYRSWEVQAENREKYLSGKKRAYVAKPGGSFHNAGRAVDIKLELLQFEGVDRDDWLEVLWDIAEPIGFKPIIRNPDMDASEAWHFDFPGKEWEKAYKELNYSEVAKCCVLDVDAWDPNESNEKVQKMFVQSQLIRLGHWEIGKVDGIIGAKTNQALAERSCTGGTLEDIIEMLSKTPSGGL